MQTKQFLKFKTNVMHNGVLFDGVQIKDNLMVHDGMVVDLRADTRGLAGEVADNLVARGLAEYTNGPATHTSNIVAADQKAIPVSAPSGSGFAPAADTIKAQDQQRAERAAQVAKEEADKLQAQIKQAEQLAAEAAAKAAAGNQPAVDPALNAQPTPEEIAAAAESAV